MRIAVLTNAYPPRVSGGAARIAFLYNELLRSHDHEIRVWGPKPRFYELGKMGALSRLWFHLCDFGSDTKTMEEIVSWKPDVLLTHNLTGCGFGTPARIRSKTIRWVHVLHDVQLIEPSGQIVFGESMPFIRLLWRYNWSVKRHFAMGEPDAVASPTKWLLDFHMKFGWFKKTRAEVVPNPVVAGSCPGSRFSDRAQLDEKTFAGSPGDTPIILYVGRLDQDKGIDLLIEAWKTIRSSASKLVLIGDGSKMEELKRLSDPTIDVRGPKSPEEVAAAMCDASVVVVPSRVFENQPTVILEALSAGCRVVAADVGGVRETLGDAGWIVKPGSVEELVLGIQSALSATEDARRDEACKRILEAHDPERSVGALLGLFKSNL